MQFLTNIEVIEVGPRDGLQNEKNFIPTAQKKALIAQLVGAGVQRLETAAFVHPKWVPQMKDAEEIVAYCNELNITYIALTPNMKALERAIDAGVPQIAVFIGASSTFNEKNINQTTQQSLQQCTDMFAYAKSHHRFIRAYVSMAFHCPFEGEVPFEQVAHVVETFIAAGADEIVLGDTNGRADPKMVYERFAALRRLHPTATFVGHFHDTEHLALANVIAAMQAGVTKFDSSIGGLGGCPYSPGATGNVATEQLVHLLHKMHCQTGIHLEDMNKIVPFAKSLAKTNEQGVS